MIAPDLLITLTVRDRKGRFVSRRQQRAHSYVQQLMQLIRILMTNIDGGDVRDTSNVLRTVESTSGRIGILANANQEDRGIQVGSGSTAVAIDDFALETLIADGVGAGQLQYTILSSAQFSAVGVAAGVASFTVSRSFTNGSGADVTVREVSLVFNTSDTVPTLRQFLGARDVLAAPVVVGDSLTLTVDYTISQAE